MHNPRTLIAVRTHRADAASLSLFDRLLSLPNIDVVLCVDERNGVVDMAGRDKITFDLATLERLDLYAHPNSGWLCGDYCHIVTRHLRPDYDTYWLIEPDVLIHTANLPAFFAQFANDAADLLASGIRPAERNWFWTKTIVPLGIPPYRCFFPLTRLSARAIDCLATTRRRLSTDPAVARLESWPNDEALTASALMHAGFLCTDLNAHGRRCYTQRTFRFADFIDRDVVLATPTDELLYHPARDFRSWFTAAAATVLKLARSRAKDPDTIRHNAVNLERIARSCAENPEHADASLAPLLLARHFRSQLSMQANASNQNPADKRLSNMFGLRPGKAALATAYLLEGQSGLNLKEDQGFPLGTIPKHLVLPYAFDLVSKEVTLTLHMQIGPLLTSPDIAQTQIQTACAAVRLSIVDLPAIYGPPADHPDPIFIFPIGSAHSPLLDHLLRTLAGTLVNKPSAILQLANQITAFRACKPSERRTLIQAAIEPFQKVASGTCFVQMPPDTGRLAADIIATFPKARYVTLCRHHYEWASDAARAGALNPTQAASRLLEQLATLRELKNACPGLILIHTRQISADPADALARTTGLKIAIDEKGIGQFPAGHTTPLNNVEQNWIERFGNEWAERRPQDLPKELSDLF